MFSSHWGQLCLRDEIGLLSTRQPVISNRASFCTRREKGWSNHSLSCPLPWSPKIHKSSAGIAGVAALTGVPAAAIVQAAEWWGTASTAMLLHARGIEHHTQGTENCLACINLVLATGKIGKPGC